MAKSRKDLGFLTLAVGFIFLFNPNITVVDFLPDFIGYTLICIGISQLAYLSPYFERAAANFRKMMITDIFKMLSLPLVFVLFYGDQQIAGLQLFTFVFAALEMFLLIPGIYSFFAGIEYSYTRFGGEAIQSPKSFTLFFLVLRAALTVLPEFFSATYDDASETIYAGEYVNLLRAFTSLIVLVFGIIWIVQFEKYLFRLRKDETLISSLRAEYDTKIAPDKSIFIRSSIKMSFAVLTVASLFMLDIHGDGINIIPDALAGLAMAAGMLFLRKYTKRWKIGVAASAVYMLSGVVSLLAESNFYNNHSIGTVGRDGEATAAFYRMCTVSAVKSLISIVAVLSVIYIIFEIIDKYTVFAGVNSSSEGNVMNPMTAHVLEEQKELKHRLFPVMIFAVLSAAAEIWYHFSLVDAEHYAAGFHIGEISWIFNFVFTAALVVSLIFALTDVRAQNESKYMLS